jgi:glycosyltransferase involved in cell wall biosynthesis
MVGSGPNREQLVVRAAGLDNVTLHPPVPVEQVGSYLQAADVLVVPLRNEEHFRTRFPAKLFDAWVCGKPVLIGYDGDARQLATSIGAGTFAPSDEPDALNKEIRRLAESGSRARQDMGRAGQEWVRDNATRAAAANRLADQLERLVRDRSGT